MSDARIITGGGPTVSGLALVSADQDTIEGSGTGQDPLRGRGGQFQVRISHGNIQPTVVPKGAALEHGIGSLGVPLDLPFVTLCVGNAAVQCLGLALKAGVSGDAIRSQFSGIVEMTEDEWDAIAGTTGGLSGGVLYFVSQSTPGNLTSVAPTPGQHSIQVGVGLSSTQMFLSISPPTIAP